MALVSIGVGLIRANGPLLTVGQFGAGAGLLGLGIGTIARGSDVLLGGALASVGVAVISLGIGSIPRGARVRARAWWAAATTSSASPATPSAPDRQADLHPAAEQRMEP
jgi:hypothetical protein